MGFDRDTPVPDADLPGPDNAVVWQAGPGLTFGYDPAQPVLGAAVEQEDAAAGLHLQVRSGRLTALLGPNGSGKSTLLRLLLGQLRPDRGAVTLMGRDLRAWRPRELARRVAYVPQRGSVSLGFTVREVVAMGRFAFGDRAGVVEAMAALDLAGLADRPVRELSGGQQQRVLLARAWAQSRGELGGARPAAGVLADEPATHLDLRHVQESMKLLKALAAEGCAVLVVLHDLSLAQRWADEVVLLHRGVVAAQGSPADVLTPQQLRPIFGVDFREATLDGRSHLVIA